MASNGCRAQAHDTARTGGATIELPDEHDQTRTERIRVTSVEAAAFARHGRDDIDVAMDWLTEWTDLLPTFLGADVRLRPEAVRRLLHALFRQCPTGWDTGTLTRFHRLSVEARRQWGDPVRVGDRVAGVVVGDGRREASRVEDCGLCGKPVVQGRSPSGHALLKRINGVAYHSGGKTGGPIESTADDLGSMGLMLDCWYHVHTQRLRAA